MEQRVFLFANDGALGGVVPVFFAFFSVLFVSWLAGLFLYCLFLENSTKDKKVVEDGRLVLRWKGLRSQHPKNQTHRYLIEMELTPLASNATFPVLPIAQMPDTTENTIDEEKSKGEAPQQLRVESSPAKEAVPDERRGPADDDDSKMRLLYFSILFFAFYIIASELQLK